MSSFWSQNLRYYLNIHIYPLRGQKYNAWADWSWGRQIRQIILGKMNISLALRWCGFVKFFMVGREYKAERGSSNEEKDMNTGNVVGEIWRKLLTSTLTIGSPFLIQPLKSLVTERYIAAKSTHKKGNEI